MATAGWSPYEASPWPARWVNPLDAACVTVELQGVVFRSDRHGQFGISSFTGWSEAPGGTGGDVPFDAADGGFETTVYASGREITLEGDITGRTHRELEQNIATLGQTLTSPRWDWLTVHEEAPALTRYIHVWRPRRPEITRLGPTYAIFTLTLQSAGYPRLGAAKTIRVPVWGSAPAVNAGDYPAQVTAVFNGPLTKPSLRFGGATPGTWRYTSSMGAGPRLSVDFTRRIVRNPATGGHSRRLAVGDWPVLAPGQTTFWLTAESGTGWVDLTWRSAWN